MRVAALVKQIPTFEDMRLGADGRLRREGVELEMNPYCRRAVAKAVEIAQEHEGEVTVVTLGPPSADDTLREAIAWADARGVPARGVLVTDPAFAGSDTFATARALAAALSVDGPFDLVLVGRNSVDADTGQVGPELAELLDLPFATGVRHLSVASDGVVRARCEHDDGWVQVRLRLPAVLSTAERLTDPCKVDPEGRSAVDPARITVRSAADLGPGPWGQAGSPTRVGATRIHDAVRMRRRLDGPLAEQVRAAVAFLFERGALEPGSERTGDACRVPPSEVDPSGPLIGVVVEPDRDHLTRELLGRGAVLAAELHGHVTALVYGVADATALGGAGADHVVLVDGAAVEEDAAAALAAWCERDHPWAALAPSTAWGREVASRAAARLGAGLTGDAVDLEVHGDRLVAWKPAFGGQLVAAITAASPTQMATVRAGMLPRPLPRDHVATTEIMAVTPRGRVEVLTRTREDDLDVLAGATVVIGVGRAVPPERYGDIDPLLQALSAELGATRKVTDQGWLPRSRQIGVTGRSIAPRLYVALGASGSFNHIVGVRVAGTVLAVNADRDAPVFTACDVGIVGDWAEVIPLLVAELERATQPA